MRSSSFARVVIASLGASVVITLGCGESPGRPLPVAPFARSISPTEGSSVGGTVARIEGDRFQSGDTVTVDGSPVDATVLSATAISLTMPAHAAGQVKVTVSPVGARSQAQVSQSQSVWFTYLGPPVISELRPNIGSTGGGTPMTILGDFWFPLSVSVGGIVTPFEPDDYGGAVYLSTPAHAAGTVEVIVTNPDGRTGSAMFTYASPATFDFNGDWQGWAQDLAGVVFARLVLTIRDNIVVSASCDASSLTLDPPPVVANGEFSFAVHRATVRDPEGEAAPQRFEASSTPSKRTDSLAVLVADRCRR